MCKAAILKTEMGGGGLYKLSLE